MNRMILNYLFNAAYQLLVVLLPFITTPYVARVLGPEMIGVNAYSFSIIQILMVIGMAGIPLYGSRQIAIYANKGKEKLSSEFWAIYLIQSTAIVISIIVYLLYSFTLSEFWKKIFLLQGLNLLASMLDITWLLIGLQRLKETVTRNFIFKIFSIILIFIFVKNKNDLNLYILIVSGTTLIGQLILWYYAAKFVNLRPNFKLLNIRKHIKPVLILFFPQVIGQLYLSVDKIILKFYTNDVQVGYYDQALKITKLVLTIVTSVGIVMLPAISAEFAKGNVDKIKYYAEKVCVYILFITIPMVIGLSGISSNFISWFLGKEFLEVAALLKIISPIIIFIGMGSLFGIQILAATNQNNKLTLSILGGAIISIVVSIIFVPIYGVYASAVATLLAEATVAVMQFIFVRNYIEFQNIYKSFILYIVAAILMMFFILMVNLLDVSLILKTFIQIVLGSTIYIGVLFILKERFIYQVKNQVLIILSKKFNR